ncbi:MAG TPA: biotin--[acetyl-CoA-carboxylase] ligase [Luteibaculaceae bacterium]|nr:biotin--[acetyl-CoA-carboxylase] ligase [Luteibaculaceae bacterium]
MRLIGHQIVRLDAIDSTNNYAANLLNTPFGAEGTVIMAYDQFAGKGQRGSIWLSKPGENLTFSLILRPTFLTADDQYYLSKWAALAVAEALTHLTGIEVHIKWPNDLYCGVQKLGGMLIEATLQGNALNHAIVGVGININQMDFDASLSATSLSLLTGQRWDMEVVLEALLQSLNARYIWVLQRKWKEIDQGYLSRLLDWKGVRRFESRDGVFQAKVLGVNKNGLLQLEQAGGEIREYDLKEVKWLF